MLAEATFERIFPLRVLPYPVRCRKIRHYCSDFATLFQISVFNFSLHKAKFALGMFIACYSRGGAYLLHKRKSTSKYLVALAAIALLLFSAVPCARAQQVTHFLIDDFEDGDYTTQPAWWRFDGIELEIHKYGSEGKKDDGTNRYFLSITGKAKNWYVGGLGTYLARPKQDLSVYTFLGFDVYGYGPESGQIKIELIDDDNGNWKVEYDEEWVPLYDDRFIHELQVDWEGWKHVEIPISAFQLDNSGKGNGIWNPLQKNGSGGLLQIQLIAIASSKIADVKFSLDNLFLGVDDE